MRPWVWMVVGALVLVFGVGVFLILNRQETRYFIGCVDGPPRTCSYFPEPHVATPNPLRFCKDGDQMVQCSGLPISADVDSARFWPGLSPAPMPYPDSDSN